MGHPIILVGADWDAGRSERVPNSTSSLWDTAAGRMRSLCRRCCRVNAIARVACDTGRKLRAEASEQLLVARARIGFGRDFIEALVHAEPELLELERQLGHERRIHVCGRRHAARTRRLRNLLQVSGFHPVDHTLHRTEHAAHFGKHEIAFVRRQQNRRASVGRHPCLTANEEESSDGNRNQPEGEGSNGQHTCTHGSFLRDPHK